MHLLHLTSVWVLLFSCSLAPLSWVVWLCWVSSAALAVWLHSAFMFALLDSIWCVFFLFFYFPPWLQSHLVPLFSPWYTEQSRRSWGEKRSRPSIDPAGPGGQELSIQELGPPIHRLYFFIHVWGFFCCLFVCFVLTVKKWKGRDVCTLFFVVLFPFFLFLWNLEPLASLDYSPFLLKKDWYF